jgi:Flp pilus assembly protein CpaB
MLSSPSRNRNLMLAGLLAVAAGAVTMLSVGGAKGGTREARSSVTASVLVATRDLPVGLSLDQAIADHAVAYRKVDVELIEPNAVLNPGAIRGQVVLQPIYKGEQVTLLRLGPTGQQGLRTQLSGTLRVMQVAGTPEQLLAGTARAGDHVDVVASLKQGTQATAYSKVAIHNLLVLAAPSAASAQSAAPATQVSATLQLTDAQAQQLFFVLKNADWSLLLRPATGVRAGATGWTTASSLLARG